MINGSPRITGDRVEAEFEITRPVAGVRCFLRSQIDRIWQNCEFYCVVCMVQALRHKVPFQQAHLVTYHSLT